VPFSDNDAISPGDEILKVNGLSVSEIKENMMLHVTSDGYNQTHKLHKINQTFAEQYATFIEHPDEFKIEFRKPGNDEIKEVTVLPVHHNLIETARAEIDKTPTISFPDDKTMVWTIKSFLSEDIRKCGRNFKSYYKVVFRMLEKRKVENLIIDLRGNYGGIHTACVELFRYLTDESFKPMEYVEKVARSGESRTKLISKPNYALHKKNPSNPHFSGKLMLLVDGGSYSATTEFVALIRRHNRGVVVGEESGGGFHGCTAGRTYSAKLPNTGIKVYVPKVDGLLIQNQDLKTKLMT